MGRGRRASIIFIYIYILIYLFIYIRVVRRALNLLCASFSPIFQYFSAHAFLFLPYFNHDFVTYVYMPCARLRHGIVWILPP